MSLRKAYYDEETNTFAINNPINKFFVKISQIIEPNSNYYFCLSIRKQLISFTNKFYYNDQHDLYELDFFMENIVLPMNILSKDNDTISVICIALDLINGTQCLDIITELYYESIDDYIPITREYSIFYPEDDSFIPRFVQEDIISYHDSPLASHIRNYYDSSLCKKNYGSATDNIIRYKNGMCELVYYKINMNID